MISLKNNDKYVVKFYNHSRKDFEDIFNIENVISQKKQ